MADASRHLANAEAMVTGQLKEQPGLFGLIDKEEGEGAVGKKEVVGEAFVGLSEDTINIPERVRVKKLEEAEAENEGAARSTVGFEGMEKEEEISKGDIGDGGERVNIDMKEELEDETREEILLADKVEGLRKEEDGIFKTEEDPNRKEESSEEPADSLDCLKQKNENFEIEADKEGGQLDIKDQTNNDDDVDKSKDKEEVAENIQSSEDAKNKEGGVLKEANKEMIEEPEKEELEQSHSNYSTPAEYENEDEGTRGGFIQVENIDGLAKDIEEKNLGGAIGVPDQLEGKKEEETVDKEKLEEAQMPEDSMDDKKENLLEKINESLPIAMNGATDHTTDASPTVPQVASRQSKGLLDKIKEKLPSYGAKLEEKKESAAVH